MTIIHLPDVHLPDDRDDARDNAIDAREWQAQERASRAERLHLSDADDAYRHACADAIAVQQCKQFI